MDYRFDVPSHIRFGRLNKVLWIPTVNLAVPFPRTTRHEAIFERSESWHPCLFAVGDFSVPLCRFG